MINSSKKSKYIMIVQLAMGLEPQWLRIEIWEKEKMGSKKTSWCSLSLFFVLLHYYRSIEWERENERKSCNLILFGKINRLRRTKKGKMCRQGIVAWLDLLAGCGDSRRYFSQFQNLKVPYRPFQGLKNRRSTFPNNIKFANLLILRL